MTTTLKRALYGIFDKTAKEFLGGPFAFTLHRSEQSALRTFADIAAVPNSVIAQHPDDFIMKRVAYLDENTNELIPADDEIISGTIWAATRPQPADAPSNIKLA